MTLPPEDEPGPEVPIPPVEEDNLLLTYADAMELAEEGDVAGGRELLDGGLSRAEDLETAGEAWGEALVIRYRLALRRYAADYGATSE